MRRKWLAVLAAAVMMLGLAVGVSAEVVSGNCGKNGDNLTWEYDTETCVLRISGEGEMEDYDETFISGVGFTTIAPWGTYEKSIKTVCLDDGIVSIGEFAFYECSGITELSLPDSLTSIGNNAFFYCSGITELTLPSSLTSIGSYAFYSCSGITELSLPDSLASIGNSAFSGCSGITELHLPDSLISIGELVFSDCSGITELNLPDSITSIGDKAFLDCSGITKLTLSDSLTFIGDYAFQDCFEIKELTLPNSLASIGDYAFRNCSGITKLTLSNSITSIENSAFYGCSGITELTLPDSLTSIGNSVFQDCYKLKKVIIPNTITSLGNYIFEGCTALTTVTLPENLSTIGTYTFSGCKNLTEITFPAILTKIGGMAFGDCTSLKKATFHGDAPELGSTTFKNTSADLTLHYIDGKTGWTSPTWEQSGVTYNTATFIPATHHTVTLPDIFTGTESVVSGADYIFSQSTDGQYYTYTNITATMSGEPVPVTHNGDGTYTIANVTGDLVISGTRTPKTDLSLLLSDASGCTIHDGCLLGLPAGKTAGDVLALFANLSSGLSVHTADGTTVSASTHIGSGYTVRLTVDGTLYDTLTIVIRGDVNGDRFADELDLLFLQQYYAGHPVKPVHPLAGDINDDGALTRADVMLLSRTVAGWYAADTADAFCLFRPSDISA